MEKIIFGCLVLALSLWGCDGDDGSRDCVSVFALDNSECLAEDLLRVCPRNGGYACEVPFSEGLIIIGIPTRNSRNRCTALDCQTIGCNNYPNFPSLNFPNIVFADLNIVEGTDLPDLEGVVITNGGEAQLENCRIFQP